MKQPQALRAVSEHAAGQWGLVTAAQARAAGLTAVDLLRLTEAELLENVGHGVYLVAGAVPPKHQEIKVAWLRLNPGTPAWRRQRPETYEGVISHASACVLHDIGDIPATTVTISTPRRRTTREPNVRLLQRAVDPADVTLIDGLPVTTPERTIVDLLADRADGGHIAGALADARHRSLLDLRTLAPRATPYAKSYGLPPAATGHDLVAHLLKQPRLPPPPDLLTRALALGLTLTRALANPPPDRDPS
ncbi:type IV toxin-antitoxin system AbiEi family antitoxin domain-containing protein [Sphaerisporangium sp. B11E5]|uniref:type IV toxin-antitoxin system AbiEi family antitoxin domain-containing protein n=1 Tax=Sphaerisporangium sp. B11E5 TaxID=3153563 RepID=UPI00325D4E65